MDNRQILLENMKQLRLSSKLSLVDYTMKLGIDLDRYESLMNNPDAMKFNELERITVFHDIQMKHLFVKDFF